MIYHESWDRDSQFVVSWSCHLFLLRWTYPGSVTAHSGTVCGAYECSDAVPDAGPEKAYKSVEGSSQWPQE